MLPSFGILHREGTFFEHAYTGIPSITFPMQAAILSGCPSAVTRNCFHYWDDDTKKIIACKRYNQAETFGQMLQTQGISCLSIQHGIKPCRGALFCSCISRGVMIKTDGHHQSLLFPGWFYAILHEGNTGNGGGPCALSGPGNRRFMLWHVIMDFEVAC